VWLPVAGSMLSTPATSSALDAAQREPEKSVRPNSIAADKPAILDIVISNAFDPDAIRRTFGGRQIPAARLALDSGTGF